MKKLNKAEVQKVNGGFGPLYIPFLVTGAIIAYVKCA